jgi:hypothetical protein
MDTTDRARVHGRGLACASAIVIGLTAVLYVGLIAEQGGGRVGRVSAVILLFVAALACVIGAVTFKLAATRGVCGAAAAGMLFSMGYLALFSVGLPLLIAGMGMVVWLARTGRRERRGSRLKPIGAFVVGAVLPWTLIFLS